MDDYRGEYRTIHVAILDDEDYIDLSQHARHVLLTLKLQLGRAGIDIVYPGKIEWHTGLTGEEVDAALKELIAARWIEMERRVIWLRNGLKYETSQNLNNANHVRGIAMQLQRLPRYQVCKRWCAYYRLSIPGVASPEEVRDLIPEIMLEYTGKRVNVLSDGELEVIGEMDVPVNPRNPLKCNDNPTVLDAIGDTMPESADDGSGDDPTVVSPNIIQKQKIIQNIKQESGVPPPAPAKRRKRIEFSDDDMQCAILLRSEIALTFPGYAESMNINMESWANEFRLIRTADKRKLGDVLHVLQNFARHPFWSQQIRSPGMLRGGTRSGADRFTKIRYDLEHDHGQKRKPTDHVANRDEYNQLASRYPANPGHPAETNGGNDELPTLQQFD